MLRLAVGAHFKAMPVANVSLVYPLGFASQTLAPLRLCTMRVVMPDIEGAKPALVGLSST